MIRNRIERTASKKWRGSARRIICAAIYNLSCFSHGCSTGWVSSVLGSQALSEGAWLAALPCLVALPTAPFITALADVRGRKIAAGCTAFSFIISWSLLAWCGSKAVWAARAAAGVGGAGALALAPLYCAEIAPKMRGLAALPALACSVGWACACRLGGRGARAPALLLAAPAALLAALRWLPDSPSYLISVGRVQEAASIICWLEGSDFRQDLTDVIEQQEVHIRTTECHGPRKLGVYRQDSDTFEPMMKRSSGLESASDARSEPRTCRELFCERSSRASLASCAVLVVAGSVPGAAAASYAAALLSDAAGVTTGNYTGYDAIYNGNAALSEAPALLACGAALTLGAAAAFAAHRLPRKVLLIWSCSAIACCLALLGIFCDPRLRVYTHIWPIRKQNEFHKENNMTDNWPVRKQNNMTEIWPIRKENDFHKENMIDKDNNTDFFADTALEENENGTKFLKFDSVLNGSVLVEKGTLISENRYEEIVIWPKVVLLSCVMFLYNFGLSTVPVLLVSELFTVTVRSLATTLLTAWFWLNNFLILRYFGSIVVSLGLHTTYYISAFVTLAGGVYVLLFLPETKGRSRQEIDNDFSGSLLAGLRKGRRSVD